MCLPSQHKARAGRIRGAAAAAAPCWRSSCTDSTSCRRTRSSSHPATSDVDGQAVSLRTFDHRTEAGTEPYELLVPAALADADGTVRVRFENQDDPACYDPSIADVWIRPVS